MELDVATWTWFWDLQLFQTSGRVEQHEVVCSWCGEERLFQDINADSKIEEHHEDVHEEAREESPTEHPVDTDTAIAIHQVSQSTIG